MEEKKYEKPSWQSRRVCVAFRVARTGFFLALYTEYENITWFEIIEYMCVFLVCRC